jgi:hypothetical protein
VITTDVIFRLNEGWKDKDKEKKRKVKEKERKVIVTFALLVEMQI